MNIYKINIISSYEGKTMEKINLDSLLKNIERIKFKIMENIKFYQK